MSHVLEINYLILSYLNTITNIIIIILLLTKIMLLIWTKSFHYATLFASLKNLYNVFVNIINIFL